MKNILISILFLTLNVVNAQIVNIPDAIFKANLVGNADINTNADSEIQVSEATAFKGGIKCQFLNISDLTGIESFTALTSLACYNNQLTSLDVSKNTSLTYLDCNFNQLTSLDVSKNIALNNLACSNNQLATIDLSKNTALTNLDCGANQLTNLDLTKNTILTKLYCEKNQLSSIDVFDFKDLTSLSCANNQLTTIDVSKNLALTYLDCGGNQLTTLDITKNINLSHIDCRDNYLTVLDVSKYPALYFLDCRGNQLAILDVSENTKLLILGCSQNLFTSLDVSKNTELKYLYCSELNLTSLDVSKNIALVGLECEKNQLSSLDITKNTELTVLQCYSNHLTTLDLSKNIKLELNYCDNNQLTSIDLSKNTKLISLYCTRNQLTSIDISKNTELLFIACGTNSLDSLDVSINTKLFSVECDSNKLTNIELPSVLYALRCQHNLLKKLPELPTNLSTLDCRLNPDLNCLPKLPSTLSYLYIENTGIECIPNIVKLKDIDKKLLLLCNSLNACQYYGNISGNIHLDTAATCQLDSLYPGSKIKNIKVNLSKNGSLLKQNYVNYFGDYTFASEVDDTFLVKIDTINNPFEITCPSNQEYHVIIAPNDNIKGNLNFGLTCKASAEYGVSSISATKFRPSWLTNVFINAGDIVKSFHGIDCGFKQGGTIKIEISGPVAYVKPGNYALTPNSVTNNNKTLTYNIADFGKLIDSSFNIVTYTQSPINVADSVVCIKVIVNPDIKDNNPSNDSLTLCFPVRNSHDPNAKEVFPNTKVAGNQFVYYTVHFQNTGNDTAYTVVIKDTLSNKLNVSSFQFLNSSHRVITELENNVVTFTFPRINLVDSLTNESLSNGFVQFRIKTEPSVNVFTEVDNTAHIYFDRNDPIKTNIAYINHLTTSSTALTLNKEKIFVYPNPTKNSITISLKTSDNYKLIVSNTFGQPVLTKLFNDNSCTVLLDGLPSGIYYITVKNDSGYWVEKVVKE